MQGCEIRVLRFLNSSVFTFFEIIFAFQKKRCDLYENLQCFDGHRLPVNEPAKYEH